ncbi:hypothetical protein [Streptomyces sp. NPDC048332]|uniref:hypothetical protein n=1 Tax=unclassified Streptomyces TaxID=2593676 RepID=UPI00341BA44C
MRGRGARLSCETAPLDHVREGLAVWVVCSQSPGAPAVEDAQPEDDDQAPAAE